MNRNIDEIIRRIARQQGVSEREVIDEMRKTIDIGYGSPDPAVRAQWASMPFPGKPTPQELILYLADKLKADKLN